MRGPAGRQAGPDLGCNDVVTEGPHEGSVGGTCWVDLPAYGLSVVQDAAQIPTTASFVGVDGIDPALI